MRKKSNLSIHRIFAQASTFDRVAKVTLYLINPAVPSASGKFADCPPSDLIDADQSELNLRSPNAMRERS